jgi:hypothetical protein
VDLVDLGPGGGLIIEIQGQSHYIISEANKKGSTTLKLEYLRSKKFDVIEITE